MTKKKITKIVLIVVAVALVAVLGIGFYMFNKPHRNVQEAAVDFQTNATELVAEYLKDAQASNEKYLSDEGNSKIMAVTGKVHSISKDMNNQVVVLLKAEGEKAGVSCTFTAATNANAEKLSIGQSITVKGVIRSGAGYDADLDLYEDVIIEKCDVLKN